MTTHRILIALALALGVAVASAADAPKITVTNVERLVTPDFLGDKTVKFVPAAQISNVGILTGHVKKIRLHTHEMEDHVVYVVKGKAVARLGDETREVVPGDIISIPKWNLTASSRRGARRSSSSSTRHRAGTR